MQGNQTLGQSTLQSEAYYTPYEITDLRNRRYHSKLQQRDRGLLETFNQNSSLMLQQLDSKRQNLLGTSSAFEQLKSLVGFFVRPRSHSRRLESESVDLERRSSMGNPGLGGVSDIKTLKEIKQEVRSQFNTRTISLRSNSQTSISMPGSLLRDDITIREEDVDTIEINNERRLQDHEFEMEKPQLLIISSKDLTIKEEDTDDIQEVKESQKEILINKEQQEQEAQHAVHRLQEQREKTNLICESTLPTRSRPKISDLINRVIEKLEPEQIGKENSSSERIDEESENIKLKEKSESAVFIIEPPKKQYILDTIETQTKYNIVNEKMISLDAVNNTDCSFVKKTREEEFSTSIGNGTVLFGTTPGRSLSNSKNEHFIKASYEPNNSMKKVLFNQLEKITLEEINQHNTRVEPPKSTIVNNNRNSLNLSFNEPLSARRSLSNKRVGITPKVTLGLDGTITETQVWRPMSAKAKNTATVFTSQNGSRPNSSTRTRLRQSSFHQGENREVSAEKRNNSQIKKKTFEYAATASSLTSSSSAKVLKARLSPPNLTQRKSSVGKNLSKSKEQNEAKSTVNKKLSRKEGKGVLKQLNISHSNNEKDLDLFAIAETDKLHESEQGLNNSNNKLKPIQTENPQMKRITIGMTNRNTTLKPIVSNNKSTSIKKDQPLQSRKSLNPNVLARQPSAQRQRSTTNHSPIKDSKNNLTKQRTNPLSAKKPKDMPSGQQNTTNSAVATPRTLDSLAEHTKPLGEQSKVQNSTVSNIVIEELPAKEINSTYNSIQKLEEKAPKPSNTSNKKRLFEIMSQACE